MWVPDIGELLFSCSRPSYSPPNQRCRWFVVYGGYAAFDTSPPAIIVVAKADFPIVAHHSDREPTMNRLFVSSIFCENGPVETRA